MNAIHGPVTIVVPGDLHLTARERQNYETALCVVKEVNELIQPDFVQFIGDNVQDATEDQFRLFGEIAALLDVPHFALVGDHDVCRDPQATMFRHFIGDPRGSTVLRGFRFVRLNTLDIPRLGFSDEQLVWLNDEFETAARQEERVVLFQHHYPYKVCEDFSGPGIDRWRGLIAAHRPVAIVCGHTHYGQIANDGNNIAIAARSIGDPEGGAPGYLVMHLHDSDFAVTYRTVDDEGPVVLITHPRELPLATEARHIILGDDELRVRVWPNASVAQVTGYLDEGPRFNLLPGTDGYWAAPLDCTGRPKGEHSIRVEARLKDGKCGEHKINFFLDRTGRFTAVPSAWPRVSTTAFC